MLQIAFWLFFADNAIAAAVNNDADARKLVVKLMMSFYIRSLV
jgi:hypothetical protein